MDKRKIVVVIVVILAVVATILFKVGRGKKTVSPVASPGAGGGAEEGGSATRAPAPQDVVIPDKSSANVPENVAKPNMQTPANPANSATFRGYALHAENDTFVPDTVIVKQGDTVHLELTAVDKEYDFTQPDYGFSVTVARGAKKTFQFDATAAGKFTLFCKSCGGPSQGPVGAIVVVPK